MLTAQDAYRRRLSGWRLSSTTRTGSATAHARGHAEAERQALLGELRRATGLGGRVRRVSAEDERARVNVTRTLRAAIDRITDAAPAAGAHLSGVDPHRTGLPLPAGRRWPVTLACLRPERIVRPRFTPPG